MHIKEAITLPDHENTDVGVIDIEKYFDFLTMPRSSSSKPAIFSWYVTLLASSYLHSCTSLEGTYVNQQQLATIVFVCFLILNCKPWWVHNSPFCCIEMNA